MRKEYVHGLTIQNYNEDKESNILFKLHTEMALNEAKTALAEAPVGTSFSRFFPNSYTTALSVVKTPGGVMPFICKRETNRWKLYDTVDLNEPDMTADEVSTAFSDFFKEIKSATPDSMSKRGSLREPLKEYLNEYRAKSFFAGTPHHYDDDTVKKMAHLFKNVSEYDNDRREWVPFLYNHLIRTTGIACELARKLGFDDKSINILKNAAVLHEAGNLTLSKSILTKTGMLTSEEQEKVADAKAHGREIVTKSMTSVPENVLNVAFYEAGVTKEEKALQEILFCANKIETLTSSDRARKSGQNIPTVIRLLEGDKEAQVISPALYSSARDLLMDVEKRMSFDRNGNIDLTPYAPDLQKQISASSRPSGDGKVVSKLQRDVANVMAGGRNIDSANEEQVKAFAHSVKDTLSGYSYKDVYDAIDIRAYASDHRIESHILKNEICRMKDINNIKSQYLDKKFLEEEMKKMESGSDWRQSRVDDRIRAAQRIAKATKNSGGRPIIEEYAI